MAFKKQYYPELVSTITWMHDELKTNTLSHGYCVYTDFQTGGRGQGKNSWESERAQNVMFSLLLRPEKIGALQQFFISEMVALAISEVLEKYLKTNVHIKWPNDIYVDDRKICGILIENKLSGNHIASCIIGAGINVNQKKFLSDAPNPVSMFQLAGQTFDRDVILDEMVSLILDKYESFLPENPEMLQKQYFEKLYRNAGFFTFKSKEGEPFEAEIHAVLPTGHLVLKEKNGQLRTFAFKEVQFVI